MYTHKSPKGVQSSICSFPVYCPRRSSCPECIKLKKIDGEVSRLKQKYWAILLGRRTAEKRLSCLQEHKSTILTRLNVRRDPITSRLPYEVVCHIFEAYVGMDPVYSMKLWPISPDMEDEKHSQLLFETFPVNTHLRLGAICRQWRNIAWSHPQLWDNLHLKLGVKHYVHGPALVSEWLARSKGLPLDIRIVPPWGNDEHQYDLGRTVVKIIKKHESQWRSLHISFGDGYRDILKDPQDIQSIQQSIQNRPFLRTLSVWALHDDLPIDKCFHLNYLTALRRLQFRSTALPAVWPIIEQICHVGTPLSHLTFSGIRSCSNGEPWWPNSRVCLPTLTTLSILNIESATIIETLFDYLTAPALDKLTLYFWHSSVPPDVLYSFYTFIERSGCTLRTLFMPQIGYLSQHSMCDILSALPTLEILAVKTSGDVGVLLDMLSQEISSRSTSPLLPNLKQLYVKGYELHLPIRWSSVIGVYLDNRYSKIVTQIVIPVPYRNDLRLTIVQESPNGSNTTDTIDLTSLRAFVELWRQHKILCTIGDRRTDSFVSVYQRACRDHNLQHDDKFLTSLEDMDARSLPPRTPGPLPPRPDRRPLVLFPRRHTK